MSTRRNILATVAGVLVSGLTNGLILKAGSVILTPPEGVDPSDFASINAHIAEYPLIHFAPPFLAHAVGTLAGALIASRLAATRGRAPAMVVGAFGLIGGTAALLMIPNAPVWFDVSDLALAYLPMAWIGHRLAERLRPQPEK